MKIKKRWTSTGIALAAMALTLSACIAQDTDVDSQSTSVEELAGDQEPRGCAPGSDRLAEYDSNGDGTLDREERRAAREAMRTELLAQYDSDGDGHLNEDERSAMREDRMQNRFDQLDGNGDGFLSLDEIGQRCPLARRFEMIDADGDGLLSPDELAAMAESHGPRFPRHERPGRRSPHRR